MALKGMAEAVVLTGTTGLQPEKFFDLILETLFGCRGYEMYSSKIVRGDYEPRFRMDLGLKDLRLAVAAGQNSGRSLPLCKRCTAGVAAGVGSKDWSAVAEYTLR